MGFGLFNEKTDEDLWSQSRAFIALFFSAAKGRAGGVMRLTYTNALSLVNNWPNLRFQTLYVDEVAVTGTRPKPRMETIN